MSDIKSIIAKDNMSKFVNIIFFQKFHLSIEEGYSLQEV